MQVHMLYVATLRLRVRLAKISWDELKHLKICILCFEPYSLPGIETEIKKPAW